MLSELQVRCRFHCNEPNIDQDNLLIRKGNIEAKIETIKLNTAAERVNFTKSYHTSDERTKDQAKNDRIEKRCQDVARESKHYLAVKIASFISMTLASVITFAAITAIYATCPAAGICLTVGFTYMYRLAKRNTRPSLFAQQSAPKRSHPVSRRTSLSVLEPQSEPDQSNPASSRRPSVSSQPD